MITIHEVKKWRTSDGVEHSSHAMAVQHIAMLALIEVLADNGLMTRDVAQDVLNILGSHRTDVRGWLDSCDAMEKAAGLG